MSLSVNAAFGFLLSSYTQLKSEMQSKLYLFSSQAPKQWVVRGELMVKVLEMML
jgi:hypothetical protein